MSMAIWKYPLERFGETALRMPTDSVALAVQMQDDEVCLWALVHPQNETTEVFVWGVGTGHDFISSTDRYIGTVQEPPYVWHYFASPELRTLR